MVRKEVIEKLREIYNKMPSLSRMEVEHWLRHYVPEATNQEIEKALLLIGF